MRTTWYDNRVKNPVVERDASTATNTQQRQNLGRTRIRGMQTDVEYRVGPSLRVGRRLSVQPGQGDEFDGEPGARRQVPAAGAEAPRVGAAWRTRTRAYVNVARRPCSSRPPVRRRPERSAPSRARPSPACRRTACWTSALSRDIGRNLEVFFGVQNLFDQEYYVSSCRRRSASPRLVNGGVRVRCSGR